jgi:hypothetical protein
MCGLTSECPDSFTANIFYSYTGCADAPKWRSYVLSPAAFLVIGHRLSPSLVREIIVKLKSATRRER